MGVKVPVYKYEKLRRQKTELGSRKFDDKSAEEVFLACMHVAMHDEEYNGIRNLEIDGNAYNFVVPLKDINQKLFVGIHELLSEATMRLEFEMYVPEKLGFVLSTTNTPNVDKFAGKVVEALNSDIDYDEVIRQYRESKEEDKARSAPCLQYIVIILAVALLLFLLKFVGL